MKFEDIKPEDLGRLFVHVDPRTGEHTVVELRAINPAVDDEVRISHPGNEDSGRFWWVHPWEIEPLVGVPHPGLVRIAQDLLDYDRLRLRVRRLLTKMLEENDRSAPFWAEVDKVQGALR